MVIRLFTCTMAAPLPHNISRMFWNYSRISDYDKNNDEVFDDDDMYDITELVIVTGLVVIVLILYVIQKHREDQWVSQGCGVVVVKLGGDIVPTIVTAYTSPGDDRPPPYDPPPSYTVAVRMGTDFNC